MGFRQGAYAKVWDVSPDSPTRTKLRISTSRKNRNTGEYEQDFSGFVLCAGTAAAAKAAKLKRGDSIRIAECEVTTRYDAEKKKEYTNFLVYDLETDTKSAASSSAAPQPDDGEQDGDDDCPF